MNRQDVAHTSRTVRFLVGASWVSLLCLGIAAAQEAPRQAKPAEAKKEEKPQAAAAPAQVKVQAGGVQIQLGGAAFIGRVQVTPQAPGGEGGSNERIKLPVDPRARRKISDAQRFIDNQDWQNAVKILQMLLDEKEDNFLGESESDKGRRISIRTEANRMLGSLPREGRLFYEQQFGAQAKLLLRQAKAQGDPQALGDIALRYLHTEAGAEAAALLGSYHLDHGRYIVAALCYERLIGRPDSLEKMPATTWLKAAMAFERSGDHANRDKAMETFLARVNQPSAKLPPAVRTWSAEKFRAALESPANVRVGFRRIDWPIFMGSPDRNARGDGSAPFLEPLYTPYEPVTSGPARTEVEYAARKLVNLGFPVIPGSHAIIARGLAIFRGLDGLHAINLKSGKMEWASASDASLAAMLKNQAGDQDGLAGIYRYRDTAPGMITENTLLGVLSSDSDLVYAVEDAAIPPFASTYGVPWGGGFNPRGMPRVGDKLADYQSCNHLTAYDIEGGRAVWSIGTREGDQPFSDTYFLGPPLPLGERLYVLAESNSEIKLLCLQTRRAPKSSAPRGEGSPSAPDYAYSAELVWSQVLGVMDRRISEDPVRRTQAAVLSYSDGILICPTNAGSLIAVDLLTRSLVWAYSYQSEASNLENDGVVFFPGGGRGRVIRGMGMVNEPLFGSMQWSFSAPVISGGKVLIAPPDGKALQAINLRDGTLAWSVNRVDSAAGEKREARPAGPEGAGKPAGAEALSPGTLSDNYLAGVFDGKVILVGRQSIRALDLATGNQVWRTPVPMPTGRGTANEGTYFLPVRGNEVLAISLKEGKISGRSKALHKEPIGNLVLVGDDLVSCTSTHLLVYPQQAVKERQVAERLKVNPNDPIGLVDRGEMRRHRGELQDALGDFRTALAHEPAPAVRTKAQAKLFDVACDLLEKDFSAHEALLEECQRLMATSSGADGGAEEGREKERQGRLLRIVARGREIQGRPIEALQAYQAYSRIDDKLIPSPDDPQAKVVPMVWARGQAQAMARRLPPPLLWQLQDSLQTLWAAAQKENSSEAMQRFVDFYGDLPGMGQQAQLLFCEGLIEKRDFSAAQVRILPLTEASDKELAAKAFDALARINIRLGEMENAVYYYRLLAKRFPQVVIRDGKTAAQLFAELATDKRFLPYLDEPRGFSGLKDVSVIKDPGIQGSSVHGNFLVNFVPDQETPPALGRYAVQVESPSNNNTFTYSLRDTISNKTLLQQPVNSLPVISYGYYQDKFWPSLQVCGGILVFAWGNRIVALDPSGKKEVWSLNLLGEQTPSSATSPFQLIPNNQAPGRFQLYHASGTSEALGAIGPASSQRLTATIKDSGLVGIDPQTGRILWTRAGIATASQLFGDDEYVIVLPPSAAGQPTRSAVQPAMAVRMADGTASELPEEVETLYRNKLRSIGRFLLVQEKTPDGQSRLRLIDPVAYATPHPPLPLAKGGRDGGWTPGAENWADWDGHDSEGFSTGRLSPTIWSRGLPAGTLILHSGSAEPLVGTLAPDGQFDLLDLLNGQPLTSARIKLPDAAVSGGSGEAKDPPAANDFASLKGGYVMSDHHHAYVFLNRGTSEPMDTGGSRSLYPQYQWLRSIPIGGPALALELQTGKVLWQDDLPLQFLIVHRFREIPVFVCAAALIESRRPAAGIPAPGNVPPGVIVRGGGSMRYQVQVFSKQTGKPLPVEFKSTEYERYNRGMLQNLGIYDLWIEPASGKIELKSSTQRYAFRVTTTALASTEKTSGQEERR